MYPWESAFTGQEVCPITAETGQLEQHISLSLSLFCSYSSLVTDTFLEI